MNVEKICIEKSTVYILVFCRYSALVMTTNITVAEVFQPITLATF